MRRRVAETDAAGGAAAAKTTSSEGGEGAYLAPVEAPPRENRHASANGQHAGQRVHAFAFVRRLVPAAVVR